MHFLMLLTSLAMADDYVPWFDQAAAEDRVAEAMPDYFVALENMRDAHPDRYLERLNRALGLTVQAGPLEALVKGGVRVVEFREDEVGLEKVFLHVTRGETQ